MKVAPFRALTHVRGNHMEMSVHVEMKVAPFRALTRFAAVLFFSRFRFVEMKVAPFRALPRPH